ncbi:MULTISPECIES: MotE family protein [Thermoanaerobacter]|uniref:MgtE intracellular region n=2 Tax=Thermoanaerobacter TaxID=1754 RepID=D3T2P2_THEIA|nr:MULTISPECIES: MgtE intracellular region [Thermoanaerobacter]ADD02494.1 MgtE intracellular region [Thermoanaerobacter italicus Ab9]MDP9749949.1 flagellar protein FlbB [Thermoanaerobacter pentosaceus]
MQNKDIQTNRKLKIWLAILIIFLILVGGTVLVIYFNLFESQTFLRKQLADVPVLGSLIFPALQEDKDSQINKLTEELKAKNEKITEYETELKEKEDQINKLKAELEKVQKERELLKQQLENKQTSLKDIASYYQNMDPQNAAQILNNMSDEDVINILGYMNKDSASKILESLNADKAAKITNILLKNATMMP